MLKWFWKFDVNITRLESRPSKKKARRASIHSFIYMCSKGKRWFGRHANTRSTHPTTNPPLHPPKPNALGQQAEGVFDMFVDFEGARGEERVDALMRALDRECNSMLVLDKREVRELNFWGEVVVDVGSFYVRVSVCVRAAAVRLHASTHPFKHTCTHTHTINQSLTQSNRCRGSPATRSSSTPSPTACWTPART